MAKAPDKDSLRGRLPGLVYERPPSEQFRLARLQLYNWGTFQDYHDIEVPAEGFLITGHSGSGKTTIVDAISTMLVPRRIIEYNWAARDLKRKDRSLESYVKGAWNAQRDELTGGVKLNYLRDRSTWSAVAMTFGREGRERLTLLQIFWQIRGGQPEARRHHFILERSLSLSELDFGELDFSVPRLLEKLGEVWHESRDFASYSERFRQRLGIGSETTLRLLQKTQSIKNIEDLHSFLTEYMLDDPKTFEEADKLCEDFGNLKIAYDAVVSAERQIEVLKEVKDAYGRFETARKELDEVDFLVGSHLAFFAAKVAALCRARISKLEEELDAAERIVAQAAREEDERREALEALRDNRRRTGGERLEKFERELGDWEERLLSRSRARDQAREAFEILAWTFEDAKRDAYLDARRRAKAGREGIADDRKRLRLQFEALTMERAIVLEKVKEAEAELEELSRRPGNIPAKLSRLRDVLAEELGISRADSQQFLPFLGELFDLKADEARWRPAAEAALRDLALTLVVDDSRLLELAKAASRRSLGERLSWLSAPLSDKGKFTPSFEDGSLLSKLVFRKGLQRLSRLLSPRLEFACVEDLESLGFHSKAVTLGGLVKIDEELYLKNDDFDPADDLCRVIGHDNKAKKAAYERRLRELTAEECVKAAALESLDGELSSLEDRRQALKTILRLEWDDLDSWTAEAKIREAKEAIREEKERNQELKDVDREIERCKAEVELAGDRLAEAKVQRRDLAQKKDVTQARLEEILERDYPPVSSAANRIFEDMLDKLYCLSLSNAHEIRGQVRDALYEREKKLGEIKSHNAERAARLMGEFKKRWPIESAELVDSISSAPEFLELLASLETDALPAHRKSFSDLLNRQTREHLVLLRSRIQWEREEIVLRLGLVNQSLKDIVYNHSDGQRTRLELRMDDRLNDEVVQFKKDLKNLTGDAFGDARQTDEAYFLKVEKLVSQLTDPNKAAWRKRVLDVRDHVRFTGIEIGEDGSEIESYQSGSGKSGGQRQKLAATCLAAALRYQLGAQSLGYPVYGLVVFDEAFDKLDNESTMVVMSIFKRLGFQMLLATPLKGILASESYIGGAAVVSIKDRQRSIVTPVKYDQAARRLVREVEEGEGIAARGDLADVELAADNLAEEDLSPLREARRKSEAFAKGGLEAPGEPQDGLEGLEAGGGSQAHQGGPEGPEAIFEAPGAFDGSIRFPQKSDESFKEALEAFELSLEASKEAFEATCREPHEDNMAERIEEPFEASETAPAGQDPSGASERASGASQEGQASSAKASPAQEYLNSPDNPPSSEASLPGGRRP